MSSNKHKNNSGVRKPNISQKNARTGKAGSGNSAPRLVVKSRSGILAAPWRLLLFLIPVAVLFVMSAIMLGMSETPPVIVWFLSLMLIGLVSFPISAYLFKSNGSAGWFLSQPLGLILTGLIVWTLTYIKIFRFNYICIVLALLIVAGVSYGLKPLRKNLLERLESPEVLIRAVAEQTVFAVILVVLCYYKGYGPTINGQEKFMDYGFIMSMLRNPSLPANDMWLSGKSINYYYFGQYLYAFLIKFSNVKTGIGYNLAMCSAIAIPFTMAYSIGCMLIDSARQFGLRCGRVMTQVAGILSGFTVMIFGNSHSFFYDEDSFGHRFLKLFDKLGCKIGNCSFNDPEYSFFYPDSTRYIGYNPDSKDFATGGGDYTIEEFPFYSYLVGDLHAHVVSTMVVLLIMAVCIAMITRSRSSSEYRFPSMPFASRFSPSNGILLTEFRSVISVELVAMAVLLGCAQMTNYWDFLIYFIFSSMTLLVLHMRYSEKFSTVIGALGFGTTIAGILGVYLAVGDKPVAHLFLQMLVLIVAYMFLVASPCALSRISTGMSFIFTVSTLTALPFNYNFDMISNALGRVKNNTPFYQLYILWGTHAIICIVFFVLTFVFKNYEYLSIARKRKNNKKPEIRIIGEQAPNKVASFLAERNLIDFFVCGMIAVGFLLILAPEIFYVRDIYTGGYLRANTMFKFCYAAFIILSMCIAYAIVRLFWIVGKKGAYSNGTYACAIFFCILLLVPAHYTHVSLDQRCGLSDGYSKFQTLDGTAYLDTYHSGWIDSVEGANLLPYSHAIDWFNSEVSGSPVIMEACGDSYTDYNIVSAYTGLPTVRGWLVHEWLWRFHGIVDKEQDLLIDDPDHSVWDILDPRTDAVRDVYSLHYDDSRVEGRAEQIAWDLVNETLIAQSSETTTYNTDNENVYYTDPSDLPPEELALLADEETTEGKTAEELYDYYYNSAYELALNEEVNSIRDKLTLYGIEYTIDPHDPVSINDAVCEIIQHIISEYDVEYIIIGDIERTCYGNDNTAIIASLGEIAFTDGTLTIVKVNP